MDTDELTEEQAADLAAIRAKKKQIVAAHRIKKASAGNRPVMPASKKAAAGKLQSSALRHSLAALGIDTAAAEARLRSRSQSRGRKRSRCAPSAWCGVPRVAHRGIIWDVRWPLVPWCM